MTQLLRESLKGNQCHHKREKWDRDNGHHPTFQKYPNHKAKRLQVTPLSSLVSQHHRRQCSFKGRLPQLKSHNLGYTNICTMAETYHDMTHRHHTLQRVFVSPQMPNINPYSTYKMALLCVLYILQDTQFILAGANTIHRCSCGGNVNGNHTPGPAL